MKTKYKKLLFLYLFFLYSIFYFTKRKKIKELFKFDEIKLRDYQDFIINLNNYSIYRKSKYILLFDYFNSPNCEDFNAFTIFNYYINNNNNDAYYIINEQTELYKHLSNDNKTKNLIIYRNNQNLSFLFHYLLNSKIIIQSYSMSFFQKIASKVKYIKFLYICHAVNYFKTSIIAEQLKNLDKNKQNIILTSPYEYNLYKKLHLYDEKSMHKGGLARYDRLNFIKKNESEKNCILISFTYRNFNNFIYNNSLFKKNTIKILSDVELNSFLEKKNIDLVFIQHHHEVRRGLKFNQNFFSTIKIKPQKYLAHYIEQCSLYVTDFSSISFDFMFQNKPVLFYHIDVKDNINFGEKDFMKIDYNNSIYYNNIFFSHIDLINKIKYYVNKNFSLEKGLEDKYKTLFYNKNNITEKIVNIINNLIKND